MAKITRSINSVQVTFKAFNKLTGTLETLSEVMIGTHKDLRKDLEKALASRDLLLCSIESQLTTSKLYEMSEETFILYSNCIGEGRK